MVDEVNDVHLRLSEGIDSFYPAIFSSTKLYLFFRLGRGRPFFSGRIRTSLLYFRQINPMHSTMTQQLETALLTLTLCVTFQLNMARASTSSCGGEAAEWIQKLSSKKEKILMDHCLNKCRNSATWVEKLNEEKLTDRDRSCKDLIFIYTHKECVYFRDYVDPTAYKPCKAWTRSMYGRCMEGDAAWFSDVLL